MDVPDCSLLVAQRGYQALAEFAQPALAGLDLLALYAKAVVTFARVFEVE